MKDRILTAAISVLFTLVALALFYTQIIRFPYYSRLSKNNSIRVIPIDAPRGIIFDRNNVPLAANRLSFDAAIVYQELKDRTRLARILSEILGMSGGEILKALEKARQRPYAPVTISEDIDKDKAIELSEAALDLDGFLVETRSKRNYIYKTSASHVFGYLGEITEDELERMKDYGYRPGDLVGKDGLEKYYDLYLKGVDGGMQVEVDSRGRQVRALGLKEPSCGQDLYLTLDISLQLACDNLLGEHSGAAIVMNPKDGTVLALASHPAFDPNIFVIPDRSSQRTRLLNDRIGRPLSNRAISGTYPPGSVFKIVTASAALETKRLTSNTRFFCSGSYHLGNAKFDCWKEGGHQSQNIVQGLMNSCNVFFYNAGRAAGVDAMEAFSKLYGFGRTAGIDLPDEVRGVVPGRTWKRLHRNDNWYEGETLNYAIGQGYLTVTPLQVLEMLSAVANKGSLVTPRLVERIGSKKTAMAKPKRIGLKDETLRIVRKGLFEVVNNESGTGRRAKIDAAVAAGKTGTAQNPHGKTHAWFAGFAPYDDPTICLVVFLEHGGKGGLEPAEIAHGIFEEAKNKGYI